MGNWRNYIEYKNNKQDAALSTIVVTEPEAVAIGEASGSLEF